MQYSSPNSSYPPFFMGVGEGTGCLGYKMPVAAYGVMIWLNEDLFALEAFINILDPINGIFSLTNDHLQR